MPGLPTTVKPDAVNSVTTTLFCPLEQWQTSSFPASFRPTTMPTWDASGYRARSPGRAFACDTAVRLRPMYQWPSL